MDDKKMRDGGCSKCIPHILLRSYFESEKGDWDEDCIFRRQDHWR